MVLRHRRDGSRADRHVMMRLRLLTIGVGLALGGLLLDQAFLIWSALAVLLVGFVLRFFGKETPH